MTQTSNTPDPVVTEVHQARQQLLEKYGGLSGLLAFLSRPKDERQLVTPSQKNSEEDADSKPPPPVGQD